MADDTAYAPEIPDGYCHCGCGQKTNPARFNNTRRRTVAGEPQRFLLGHHVSKPRYLIEPETGCWIWQRLVDKHGYGQLREGGKGYLAHRYYYERVIGPIPEGMQLDHLCRNRKCVNPDHLEPVTNTENQRRGRAVKFTMEDARAIRLACLTESDAAIARRYGVCSGTIGKIRKGQTWKEDMA